MNVYNVTFGGDSPIRTITIRGTSLSYPTDGDGHTHALIHNRGVLTGSFDVERAVAVTVTTDISRD